MGKAKIILWLALAVLVVAAVWQTVSAYYVNAELQQDLQDISADIGCRIGLSAPPTDNDLRHFVIEKAAHHDIHLEPDQITVRVTGEGKTTVIYLAADYTAPINLLVYSVHLHFTPASAK